MIWVLRWVTLTLAGAVTLALVGRWLWHQVSALFTELETATDRVEAARTALEPQLSALAANRRETLRADPAIFSDPARLRRIRARELERIRARSQARRRIRARFPGRGPA